MDRADGLVLLRNSERSTWRRCRMKWEWSYNRALSPPRDKPALTFGTMMHGALEVRYPPGRKRGPHPADTFKKLYRDHGDDFMQWDDDGDRVDALELGVAMCNTYVDTYGEDEGIEIIQPEQHVQVDVCDRQGNYICTWVGTMDALYYDLLQSTRSKRVIGALEHKTAKRIDENLSIISGYGEQGLSYIWAAEHHAHHEGILDEGEHIDHVRFNWLKKMLPDTRPMNAAGQRLNKPAKDALWQAVEDRHLVLPKSATIVQLTAALKKVGVDAALLGEVSKRQPGPLVWRQKLDVSQNMLAEINRRIRAEAWEIAQFRAGKLPLTKNPTKDCDWDCPFKDACELHEMGADYESMFQLEFTTWNPYEDHELDLERTN